MPANPPQITKENSISCLQIMYVWASSLQPGGEQDRIIAAIKNLAAAMDAGDKLERGTRSAPDKPSGTRTAPDLDEQYGANDPEDEEERDKLERGTRKADDKLERGTRKADDKLERRTRSA